MLTRNQYRIFEIAQKHCLGHLGSCITCLPIIEEIYNERKQDEPFILSCGHAGLALYAVLQERFGKDAEALYLKHGIHPERDLENGIYCSTGSLRCGITIAIGMAENTKKNVYVLISDGECHEGTTLSAIRYAARTRLKNLKIYININGYSTYQKINSFMLACELWLMNRNVHIRFNNIKSFHIPFLQGMNAHYKVIQPEDWRWIEENKPNA